MTRRLIVIVGITAAVLLLLSTLLVTWVLGTQSGSRAMWNGVSDRLDGLTFESMEGRFAGPFMLRGLQFETEAFRVTAGLVELDWSPLRLLNEELLLKKLLLEDVVYTQLMPAMPSDDSPPFVLPDSLTLPVAVVLQDIALGSFEYLSAPSAEPFRVDAAALAASFHGTDLSITALSARGPLFEVDASGKASTKGNYQSSLTIDWQAMPPNLAPLIAELSIEGGLSSLNITHAIRAPYNVSQHIELSDVLGDFRVDTDTKIDTAVLQQVAESLPPVSLSGTFSTRGRLAELRYATTLDAVPTQGESGVGDGWSQMSLLANGALSKAVLTLDSLKLRSEPDPSVLDVNGRVDFGGAVPKFTLRGDWRELVWPFIGDPKIESGSGEFAVDGNASDYSLSLNTVLAVPGQTDGQMTITGRGSREGFSLDELRLVLLDGALLGSGNLQWSPNFTGSVVLEGSGLDPSILAPQFPGNIALSVRAVGGISNGSVDAELESLALTGTLRELPIDAKINGRLQDSQLSLDALKLRSGESQVSATGTVGEQMALTWSVDSPRLGDLLPGASGVLTGNGQFDGSLKMPAMTAMLRGSALDYAEYSLDKLSVDMDVDLARATPSQLDIQLDGARAADLLVSRFAATGSGMPKDHMLTLEADAPQGEVRLSLTGDLQAAQWKGKIAGGHIRYAGLAAWDLMDAQALIVGAQAQLLERGCWNSSGSRLCLNAQRTNDEVLADMDLSSFGLEYLQPIMGESLTLRGTLAAQGSFHQTQDELPEIAFTTTATDVVLRTGAASEQPNTAMLQLQPSRAELQFGEQGLLATLSMPFVGGGGVDGSVAVEDGDDPLGERPMSGQLSLGLTDIEFLNALSLEIEDAAGALTGDVTVAGTLAKPLPVGELRLANGTLGLASPGLSISDIDFVVSSAAGTSLNFDGEARSGGGVVRIEGSAPLDGAQTAADIVISGENFEALNTRDARLWISPDLRVALRDTGVQIRGELVVPKAEITPEELPQTVVKASPDQVIILDDDLRAGADASRRELDAKIRIVLGDDVSVDGFGFKGRVTGGVAVNQSPGQPTLGSGDITIVDGEYRAYGQGLVIDTGKILFAGGPISQPGVNVRAVRRPADGIVVGVSVRGALEDPEFSVFSEPSMTQSEQLSWLVLGRPLNGASDGENSMIAQAALALGLKGGNFLADRVSGGLGVDSFGIETGSGEAGAANDVNQAAFVIGKYLSPDLFVSYGIGLFDSISTIKLEYSLTDQWKVSTESSTLSSGGDVTYTIER